MPGTAPARGVRSALRCGTTPNPSVKRKSHGYAGLLLPHTLGVWCRWDAHEVRQFCVSRPRVTVAPGVHAPVARMLRATAVRIPHGLPPSVLRPTKCNRRCVGKVVRPNLAAPVHKCVQVCKVVNCAFSEMPNHSIEPTFNGGLRLRVHRYSGCAVKCGSCQTLGRREFTCSPSRRQHAQWPVERNSTSHRQTH